MAVVGGIRRLFAVAVAVTLVVFASPAASAQVVPGNDDFVNAEVLATDGTLLASNVDATTEVGEPFHFGTGGASIWYRWTAPQDGFLTVDTFGSDFDTVLAIYTGTAVDALTEVASNDDAGGLQSELADVSVVAATDYHIAVDGFGGATGNVTLTWSFWDGTDTTPPTVTISTPLEGATFVQNAVVPADYTCSDEFLGSGVASCVGDVPVGEPIATGTLGTQTFTVTGTDNAGNFASVTQSYTISGTDVTPPLVTITGPGDGSVYGVGAVVIASYTCTDELFGTGVASCIGDVADGTAIDTSTAGAFPFTVTGIDGAGNTTVVTHNYTVVDSPANDNFAAAEVLTTDGTLDGHNIGATKEVGEPDHAGNPGGASIWYQWTSPMDGYLTIETTGSTFDTVMAMYTGSSVDALTEIASNDDASGLQSRLLNVPVTLGSTYYIAVDGFSGKIGLVTLTWSVVDQFDTTPPTATIWDPIDGLTVPQGYEETVFYTCADDIGGSGIASCVGDLPNLDPLPTSVPGTFTFTATATDNAGNVGVATHTYTILANPPNDDFVDAEPIATDGTLTASNVGATEEPGEPNHAGNVAGTSIWYQWTAPIDGFLTIDTDGSDFDTILGLYSGTSVDALTEVASAFVGTPTKIWYAPVVAGETYHIAVSGFIFATGNVTMNWSFLDGTDITPPVVTINTPVDGAIFFQGVTVTADYECTDEFLGSGVASCIGNVLSGDPIDTSTVGAFSFTVTGTDNDGNVAAATSNYTVQALTNDAFADAIVLGESGEVIGSNVGATKEVGEPNHAGDPGGSSIWFQWTAPADSFFSVDTVGSDFDTTLAIYTGDAVNALIEVAADDNGAGLQSVISDVFVSAGTVYHIAVDGVAGASGQIDLDWSLFGGPTFTEISPPLDPLWVTDAEHDFWVNTSAPADVDGDGDLDLAALGYFVEYNVSAVDRFVIFMNDGVDVDGNIVFTTVDVALGDLFSGESDLAWGDFDGDGDPDLAVGTEFGTGLYQNDAGVLTAIPTTLPVYFEDSNYTGAYDLRSLTWADYDNDGDLDLFMPSLFNDVTFEFESALMRNDGPDGAGGWLFTDVNATIDASVHAQTAWADDDNDGDLDLFVANVDNFLGEGFIRIYRNNAGTFTMEEPIGSVRVEYGLADWADYDQDGDMDILVVGNIQDVDGLFKTVLRIYRNDAGTYVEDTIIQTSFFPWLDLHAATWADYDSDGDIDLLITGTFIGPEDIEGKSEVYVNEGGTFTPLGRELPAPIGSVGNGGSFTWFDTDADGDLDYFVAGAYYVPGGNGLVESQMHLHRTDVIAVNAAPAVPTGLTSTVTGDEVDLGWTAALDDSTAAQAITYDLQVQPAAGLAASSASVTSAATAHGLRLPEPGNISAVTNWKLRGLADGTYTWSLQAVDSAYNGGPIAEGTFTIGAGGDLPPTVSITSPANGATVSGTVTVTTAATDDVGVASVEVFVDGASIGFDSGGGVTFDTTTVGDGSHAVTATATDTIGQTATATVDVTVSNGPGDQPPTVSITNPTDGATVSGTVTVTTSASDDVGVASVEVFVDGVSIGLDTGAGVAWDTTAAADGTHEVSATAIDTIGQSATAIATVVVSNGPDDPPTVSITNPTQGTTVGGIVTITTSASDDLGIASVQVFVDGASIGFDTGSGLAWDTTAATNGLHRIRATATDTAGQIANAVVRVNVDNTVVDTPPTVSITNPNDGATVAGTVTVTTSSSDDVGITSVEVSVDGVAIGLDTGAGVPVDTTTLANGMHEITATATDTIGQTAMALATVTVANGGGDAPPTVSITNPNDGATVAGTVTVTTSSSDDVGVTSVEVFVDGVSIGLDGGAGVIWDSTTVADGSHQISATATDTAGQTAIASVDVTVSNTVGTATVHVGDLDGAAIVVGTRQGAEVTITVHDGVDVPVSGATVAGTWTAGRRTTTAECVTDASGSCTVTNTRIASQLTQVTFTVDDVTLAGSTYEPASNHDPDGDSDGTAIVVAVNGAV